ncbi:MAG: MoaD/ThiS family protein [Flavobacteriales bacterium]
MRILLFGSIAEKAGATALEFEVTSISELRQQLIARIPGLDRMRYAISVDRRVMTEDRMLTGSEEIAVLPPFAGG